MNDHSAYDDSHEGKREFDSEIGAIAQALRSDKEFSSKVKLTPLSDLATVLADEGFAGKILVEELVNLLAHAIDKQTARMNDFDIQRVYGMSLFEIESKAPELLDHIIRQITTPGSSEQTSVSSIAGGGSKKWRHAGRDIVEFGGLGVTGYVLIRALLKGAKASGLLGTDRELSIDARRGVNYAEVDLDQNEYVDSNSEIHDGSDLYNSQDFDTNSERYLVASTELPDDIIIDGEKSAITSAKNTADEMDLDVADTAQDL